MAEEEKKCECGMPLTEETECSCQPGVCVNCCTCGKTYHWTKIQAGHFIPAAQGNATRWDEKNIHSQCMRCNCNLGGNGAEYYPFMVNKYGEDFVNELRSRPMVKLSDADYLDLISEYSEKLKGLSNG